VTIFRGNGSGQHTTWSGTRVWKGRFVPVVPDWWDPNGEGLCVWAAWKAKGAADYATSKTDLSGNGNNLAEGNGAVPWAAGAGWGFVAANAQWLDTLFVPQNDQTQSVLVQYANAITINGYIFGMRDGASRLVQLLPNQNGTRVLYGNGGAQTVVPPLATGNIGIAGNSGYRNGAADGPALGAWAGAAVASCYIGCRNMAGVAGGFGTFNVWAVVIYDCTLTAPQMLAVANAMAAL